MGEASGVPGSPPLSPSREAGLPSEAAEDAGGSVVYTFGSCPGWVLDPAAERELWVSHALVGTLEEAGLVVTDTEVRVPGPEAWAADAAASGRLGAAATAVLVCLEAVLALVREEGAAAADEPPAVAAARRGLRLAAPELDRRIGGAARSARAACARCVNVLARQSLLAQDESGRQSAEAQRLQRHTGSLLAAMQVLHPVSGCPQREVLAIVEGRTGAPEEDCGAVIEAPAVDEIAARTAADSARRWVSRSSGSHGLVPPRRAAGSPAGMSNLGNTCYLNAVVQALAHLAPLRDAVLAERPGAGGDVAAAEALAASPGAPEDDRLAARTYLRSASLMAELRRVFAMLSATDRGHVSPHGLVEAVACFAGASDTTATGLWQECGLLEKARADTLAPAARLGHLLRERYAAMLAEAKEGLAEGEALPPSLLAAVRRAAATLAGREAVGPEVQGRELDPGGARFNTGEFFTQKDASEFLAVLADASDELGLGFAADEATGRPSFTPEPGVRTPRAMVAGPRVAVPGSAVSSALCVEVRAKPGFAKPPFPTFGATMLALQRHSEAGRVVEVASPYVTRHEAEAANAAVEAVGADAEAWPLPPCYGTYAPGQCGVVPSLGRFFAEGEAEAAPPAFVLTLDRNDETIDTPAAVPAELCIDDFVAGVRAAPEVRQAQAALAAAEAEAVAAAEAALLAAGDAEPVRAADLEARLARSLTGAPGLGAGQAAPGAAGVGDGSSERGAKRARLSELQGMLSLGRVAFDSDAEHESATKEAKRLSAAPPPGLWARRDAVMRAFGALRHPQPAGAVDGLGRGSSGGLGRGSSGGLGRGSSGCGEDKLARGGSLGASSSAGHGLERGASATGGQPLGDALEASRGVRAARKAVAEAIAAHGQHRYRLRSVVVHEGASMRAGHYTCLVRGLAPGEWWRLNDASASRISEREALEVAGGARAGQRAYLVAYERVPREERGEDLGGVAVEPGLGAAPSLTAGAPSASSAAPPTAPGAPAPPALPGAAAPPAAQPAARPAVPPGTAYEPARALASVPVLPSLADTPLPAALARFVRADNRHIARFAHAARCRRALTRLVVVLTDLAVGLCRPPSAIVHSAVDARYESLGMSRAELERWARDELTTLEREGGVGQVLDRIEEEVARSATRAGAVDGAGRARIARPLHSWEVKQGWGSGAPGSHGWSPPPPVDARVYPGLGKAHAAQPPPVPPWALPPGVPRADLTLGGAVEEMALEPWLAVRTRRFVELLVEQVRASPDGFGPQVDASPFALSKLPVSVGGSALECSVVVPLAIERQFQRTAAAIGGDRAVIDWLNSSGYGSVMDMSAGGPQVAVDRARGREVRRAVAASAAVRATRTAADDVRTAAAGPSAAVLAFQHRKLGLPAAPADPEAALDAAGEAHGAAIGAFQGDPSRSSGRGRTAELEDIDVRPLPGRLVPGLTQPPPRALACEREFLVPLLVEPRAKKMHPSMPRAIWAVCDEALALDLDAHRLVPDSFVAEARTLSFSKVIHSPFAQHATAQFLQGTASSLACHDYTAGAVSPLAASSCLYLTPLELRLLLVSDELCFSELEQPGDTAPDAGMPLPCQEAARIGLPRGTVAAFLARRFGHPAGDLMERQFRHAVIGSVHEQAVSVRTG